MSQEWIRVKMTRQELFDKVWSTPMQKLAKEFNLSDVGLAKVCRKHQIPRPPRGYWARIEAGQKIPKPKLPKLGKDSLLDQIFIERPPIPEKPTEPAEPLPDPYEEIRPILINEGLPGNKIYVPEQMEITNKLVLRTMRKLRGSSSGKYGTSSAYGEGVIRVSVFKESIERAGRVLQVLIQALDARGLRLRIKSESNGPNSYPSFSSIVEIQGEEIEVGLEEASKRIPYVPPPGKPSRFDELFTPKYSYISSGRLFLKITNDPWRNLHKFGSDKSPVEDQLNAFIQELYKTSIEFKRHRAHQEEQARIRAEQERKAAERREQIRIYNKKVKLLEDQALEWEKCNRIRAYLNTVEQQIITLKGVVDPESPEGKWLVWCRLVIDQYDPLLKGNPWEESYETNDYDSPSSFSTYGYPHSPWENGGYFKMQHRPWRV